MKICPNCPARHKDSDQTCPTCGTELLIPEEHAPETLQGKAIGGEVHLERLVFGDLIAQRYRGHLIESRDDVRVLVFDQSSLRDIVLDPGAGTVLREDADSFPETILATLQTNFESESPPYYIIEEAPHGQSLAKKLQGGNSLDWRKSLKIAARTARNLEWLEETGYSPVCLHPRNIFISDSDLSIQLGETSVSEILAFLLTGAKRSPLQRLTPSYLSYLPRGLLDISIESNEDNFVYVLGILLYEMLTGQNPFLTDSAEVTRKRNIEEKPLYPSLMAPNKQIPEALSRFVDNIFSRKKGPKSLSEFIEKCSSLLDVAEQEIAPEIAGREPETTQDTGEDKRLDQTRLGIGAIDDIQNTETSIEAVTDSDKPAASSESEQSSETERNIKETLLLDQEDIENISKEDQIDASNSEDVPQQNLPVDETRDGRQIASKQPLNEDTRATESTQEPSAPDHTHIQRPEPSFSSPQTPQESEPKDRSEGVESDNAELNDDFWETNLKENDPVDNFDSSGNWWRIAAGAAVALLSIALIALAWLASTESSSSANRKPAATAKDIAEETSSETQNAGEADSQSFDSLSD